ncbi:T9SS sorting signal type C domain-containing protein, partial [Flavobacterium undicola]|uniref:T9SS sorting signal type C domain-containing protein n=1 Tax=Flavobacterium undicola TaxID=1932779 RepID=UPI001377DA66
SGATSSTYLPPAGLTTTTSYQRYAKDGTCNTTPTVSTGTWTVTVRSVFTSGTITTTGETICNGGTPVTTIGSATASSGGDNTITYKWQANGVDIASSNSATYDPPTGLTANTTYTRYAKDNTCNTTFTVSSGSWLVTVDPASVGGSIAGSTSVCTGTNSTTLTLSGYTGSITKWQSSPSGTFASSVTDIANTTTTLTATNLTATTYYRAVVTSGTCSASNSTTGTITVNPNLAASVSVSAFPSGAICSGTSVTFTATPTYGGTTPSYQWKLNGGNVGSDSSTYTNAALVNGDVVTCEMTSNATPCSTGSPAISNSSIIMVNSLPSTPTAGAPTNPNCVVPTGSVLLSGLPANGTIIQTGSHNDTVIIIGGGTQTITGLLPGNYNFTISNGDCTSASVDVTIISSVTNTWSSGSWSNGTPTINQRLVFASDYSNLNDVNLEGCSCQVTGTAAVTIKSGRTLKIENGVDIASTGSLIFENNASLVQINDAAINSGNINYKRYTNYVKRYDFTYWSSPVVGQTLYNLSPNTLYDKYYSYNNGWVISYYGLATMVAGNGYLIRAPQTFSVTDAAIDTSPVFIGKPNNGVVTLSSLVGNKSYLLGNPYPSAINADAFLEANSAVLEGTLYFWTHNTSPINAIATNAYKYNTNDYITYNNTGGVGATGMIAAGQGFFAPTKAAGNVVFNNSMRIVGGTSGVNNSQFFKLSTTSKSITAATTEKSRIWLNLTNKEGAYKQMLIGYITGATNNYDAGFDGVTYDGNQYVDFYSINNAVNLSIQGRALPFVKKDSVALGYKSTIKGDFQISIDHTDGELTSQTIFLEDTVLKVLHDLTKSSYIFSTEIGRFNTRFVLRYVDKNAVQPVVDTPQVVETVFVSVNNNEIGVSSIEDLISKIIIYDISGNILYQKEGVSANDYVVQHLLSSQQVLFVNVVLANGKITSTKIIY